MPIFSLTSIVANNKKQNKSKESFTKKVEKGVTGSIYINDEGDFVIKYNDIFYPVSKETLKFKHKKMMFKFDNSPTKITIIYLQPNNTIEFQHPFMTLAPGYFVEGSIIKDVNNKKYFDVKKIDNAVDIEARTYFVKNKNKLIKLYNERHTISESS